MNLVLYFPKNPLLQWPKFTPTLTMRLFLVNKLPMPFLYDWDVAAIALCLKTRRDVQ